MNKHNISRRNFLGKASCLALGSTSLVSTLNNLKFINAASISSSSVLDSDYKALVCIMLSGGADSHNMLVPRESGMYDIYRNSRGNVAINREDLLILNNTDYSVHPAMREIRDLFNTNKLSFISNIGTLLQPLRKDEVLRNESNLPLGLFSHADQIKQWQTSLPQSRESIGWGGRIADMMSSMNGSTDISMNISLSGNNIFQTGHESLEYAIHPESGSLAIDGHKHQSGMGAFDRARMRAVDNILDAHYNDVFQKTYVDVINTSRQASAKFSEALDDAPYMGDLFEYNDFSNALQMIARTIAVREKLGMNRQIFFVDFTGWDHHDELLTTQIAMLRVLSKGLQSFDKALDRLGVSEQVTSFTCSEFGRTLTTNGDGTDHAWGGNVMVMGGAVEGGKIFGEYPILELNSDYELGGTGIMLPTTSVDEYFAELALWFGVEKSELKTILPNISEFYDTNLTAMPVGFLG